MLKRTIAPAFIIFSLLGLSLSSCDQIGNVLQDYLTQDDATAGLKEALRVGTDTSVTQGSAVDGYFGNELIKILMPPEAAPILSSLSLIPGGSTLVDQVVLKLNRAAEDAAPQAKDILVNAIVGITINDAVAIVNGQNDAATQYLQTATQDSINMLFRPVIEQSLQDVGAQAAWEQLTTAYNSIPLVTPVNTDLAGYTTDRATTGLFKLIAIEEGKIRDDPLHRVNEILQSIFGN